MLKGGLMFHQNQLASTASLSQLLRNDIQLLDSSFESSSSLQLSAPSSEKNDIQKQTTHNHNILGLPWSQETFQPAVERLTNQGLTLATHAHRLQVVPQFPKTPQIPTESKLQGSATLPACQPQHLHEHCFNDMAKKTWIPFPSKCFWNIYMTRSYQHCSIRHSMNLLRKKRSRVLVLHLTWTLRSTSQSWNKF